MLLLEEIQFLSSITFSWPYLGFLVCDFASLSLEISMHYFFFPFLFVFKLSVLFVATLISPFLFFFNVVYWLENHGMFVKYETFMDVEDLEILKDWFID